MRRHRRLAAAAVYDLCAVGSVGLLAAGTVAGLETVLAHLAWALPLATLPARPGTAITLLLVLSGVALRRVARPGSGRR
jgi:hypothetical protein